MGGRAGRAPLDPPMGLYESYCNAFLLINISAVDPGFPTGVGTEGHGNQLIIWPNFLENCMKMKNWEDEGGVDPPLYLWSLTDKVTVGSEKTTRRSGFQCAWNGGGEEGSREMGHYLKLDAYTHTLIPKEICLHVCDSWEYFETENTVFGFKWVMNCKTAERVLGMNKLD